MKAKSLFSRMLENKLKKQQGTFYFNALHVVLLSNQARACP